MVGADPALDSFVWSNQRVTETLTFSNITVDAVNIDNNVNNLSMNAGAVLNVSNAFDIGGIFANGGNSTVNYDGANAQFIAGVDYFNLTISGSGDKTAAGNIGVAGAFDLAGTAVFAPSNFVVTYDGADQTIAAVDYHDLVLAGTGTKTWDDGANVAAQLSFSTDVILDITNTFNVTDAHFTNNENGTILYSQVADGQNVNSLHYHDLELTGGTKVVTGDVWLTGDFDTTATDVDLTTNSTTFSLIDNGAQSFDLVNFYNLVLEGGGTKTPTAGDLSVANDMLLDDGVSFTVTGNALVGNDLDVEGGSTLIITGDAGVTNDLAIDEASSMTVGGRHISRQ